MFVWSIPLTLCMARCAGATTRFDQLSFSVTEILGGPLWRRDQGLRCAEVYGRKFPPPRPHFANGRFGGPTAWTQAAGLRDEKAIGNSDDLGRVCSVVPSPNSAAARSKPRTF